MRRRRRRTDFERGVLEDDETVIGPSGGQEEQGILTGRAEAEIQIRRGTGLLQCHRNVTRSVERGRVCTNKYQYISDVAYQQKTDAFITLIYLAFNFKFFLNFLNLIFSTIR